MASQSAAFPPTKWPRDAKVLASGAVAGACSRSSVAPLERVKIMMQVQDLVADGKAMHGTRYNSTLEGLRGIVRHEGPSGLFKGNGTNVVRILPYSATQFLVFDKLKTAYVKFSGKPVQDHNPLDKLLMGSVAGACSVVVSYPLDFVRGRLSVQGANTAVQYSGIMNAITTIARQEGPLQLYHGMKPSLVGIMPYVGIQFMTYHTLKPMAVQRYNVASDKDLPISIALACGAVAGAAAQTAAYPFDLLRRRFQMQGFVDAAGMEGYSSMTGAFKHVVRTEGFRGLYKGLAPNYAKVIPVVAVQFAVFEEMKKLLEV